MSVSERGQNIRHLRFLLDGKVITSRTRGIKRSLRKHREQDTTVSNWGR